MERRKAREQIRQAMLADVQRALAELQQLLRIFSSKLLSFLRTRFKAPRVIIESFFGA